MIFTFVTMIYLLIGFYLFVEGNGFKLAVDVAHEKYNVYNNTTIFILIVLTIVIEPVFGVFSFIKSKL